MPMVETGWFATGPRPRPGIQSYYLRARDPGDAALVRALIAIADRHGDPWLAFTLLRPDNALRVTDETTVLVRGRHCDFIEAKPDGSTIAYGVVR